MADTGLITASNPGRSGVAFRAEVGTTLPTNALDELDLEVFHDQGIVSEEGVKDSPGRDTTDVKAYGGDIVYTLQDSYGIEKTFTLLESTNVETLRTVVGDSNVVQDDEGNITVRHNKTRLPRCSWVFDHIIDQGLLRQTIGVAQVVNVSEVNRVHSDVVKYELTLRLYPDAQGDYMLEYYALDEADALGIATAVLTPAKEGEEMNIALVSAGGAAPYTYKAVGALPAGVEVTEDGHLRGTPTVAGQHQITIEVTDQNGKRASKTLILAVNAKSAD